MVCRPGIDKFKLADQGLGTKTNLSLRIFLGELEYFRIYWGYFLHFPKTSGLIALTKLKAFRTERFPETIRRVSMADAQVNLKS